MSSIISKGLSELGYYADEALNRGTQIIHDGINDLGNLFGTNQPSHPYSMNANQASNYLNN